MIRQKMAALGLGLGEVEIGEFRSAQDVFA
jgi:hypothetical protein